MALRLKLLAEGRPAPGSGSGASAEFLAGGPSREVVRELGTQGEMEIRLGRHPDNDLELPYAGISAVHARLFRRGAAPEWWLEDLGSSNGTWLGARRLPPGAPHLVRPGDRVRLGGLTVVVDDVITASGGLGPSSTESTATLGRRLIGDDLFPSAPVAPAPLAPAPRTGQSAPAPSAVRSAAPPGATAPGGRTSSSRSFRGEAPVPAARPAKRLAVIGFAVTMTALAVSGLVALALSLR